MKLLQSTTALRARVALRPRSVVLRDQHGTLSAGELMDLVDLHRRRSRRSGAPPGLGALPVTAPLRQVLVTALAGDGRLEMRSSGSTAGPRLLRRSTLTPAQLTTLTDLARRIGLRPGRTIACAAPGVHGHGLQTTLGALALGAPLLDLTHLPTAERIELLHRGSVDLLTGVPVHLHDILEAHRSLGQGRPLRIPRIVSGSDMLSSELRADLARHFRARVHDVYGTTETGTLTVDGRPLRGVRMRAAGGLLHARTPFTAGRERLTDRGVISADGIVQVLGRADGTLSSGGMLHDPVAVVQVLCTHDGVREARLEVVPDARFGVRTRAVVQLEPEARPAPGAEELRALVRDRLGAAAVPREVVLSSPGG